MEEKIKILHLEDNASDSLLVQEKLKKANVDHEYFFTDNESEYISILKNQSIDLILSDYHLPGYSGSEALLFARDYFPQIPFVFLSGTMGEEVAIESLLSGATDYVLKNKMDRLIPAIKRAYNEAGVRKARQKAENELKKLSLAVEQSPNSVIITNTKGTIEYVNHAALRLTGYSEEELIGQNPRIFKSGEKTEAEYKVLWDLIVSGKEWKGEFRNKKKNGDLYWELATISPIFDENGHIVHFLAIKQDITESKYLHSELLKSKEKAEESDRLKTAFLHNITHEIRTPLNAIMGFAELLNDPELVEEEKIHFTDIIIKSGNQLLSIITDLVNIATIEAGQVKIWENEFNVNEVITLIYEQYLPKAKEKNIELSSVVSLKDTDARIKSDETKLTQILNNLVFNALKFTDHGLIRLGYTIHDGMLEFFVEDTGIGIEEKMQTEIFNRFRQVENTSTRKYGGSGLGLSISKAYIEILGGKIWVDSKIKQGSKFYFTIPHKYALIPETSLPIEKRPDIENGKRISLLIAEDEDSNFQLLEIMLSKLNLELLRACDGKEAVEICKSRPVDLVLMDIKMPVMDGYDASRLIKEFLPNLPIIAQTAYSTEADKNKAKDCGCNGFISKPLNKSMLISLMNNCLKVNLS